MPSENGWEPAWVGEDRLEWVVVPGTNPPVHLQMLKGPALQIMRAYAADFNAYIEPLRDADSACYTPTNSVSTSNHLNATAMDLNWESHRFRISLDGFDAAKVARMRELLAFYVQDGLKLIFWAEDWDEPKDCMHHQMQYDTYGDPRLQTFIDRKIRADGFSTFRRADVPVPPPAPASKADQYAVQIIAEGQRRNVTPRGIQIALSVALVESNLQMYANSNVPESMSIPHDKVGSDHDSVGLFQQRCPMWGPAEVLMDPALSAGLFYDRLVKMDYNNPARLPGDYAADVQRPAAQYRGRYQERMGDAVALYNRLADTPPPLPGDDMAQVPQDQWDRVYRELTQRLPSRSPLRWLDQTRHYQDGLVDTWAGMTLNVDGMTHVQYVKALASYNHPPTIALLREIAGGDPAKYPDRADDIKLAQAILAEATAPPVVAAVSAPAVAPESVAYVPPPPVEPRIVYVDRPVPATVAPQQPSQNGSGDDTTGQIIGRAYDALQALRLADALPIEDRAPLAALISVLSTKNGAQL